MTIKAYEFFPTWSEAPITIFANDLEQGEYIFREWVTAHFRHQPPTVEMIYPFVGDTLELRPLLARTASLGVAGVGYWDTNRHIWAVAQPQDEPCRELAPPEGVVGFYQVDADEGDDAKVFAESFEQATTLYCVWHLDRWGELPSRFTIHKRSRWELVGTLASLRDDLDAEITGVARGDNDGVWRVLPPDWEARYGRR